MLEISFGVDELLDLLDLEGPVIVGNDVCDDYRFVGPINLDLGLYLAGKLWGRYHVNK